MTNFESQELLALENRPEYKKAILDRLLGVVLIKKFGQEVLDRHSEDSLSAIAANAESPNPMSKEIDNLIQELETCQNIDELRLAARANGVELTDEEISSARLEAPTE